jgi:hypothetical protein
MRLTLKETPSLQSAQYPEPATGTSGNLMTPARRAALDALEHEFHDLLVRDILKAAMR